MSTVNSDLLPFLTHYIVGKYVISDAVIGLVDIWTTLTRWAQYEMSKLIFQDIWDLLFILIVRTLYASQIFLLFVLL